MDILEISSDSSDTIIFKSDEIETESGNTIFDFPINKDIFPGHGSDKESNFQEFFDEDLIEIPLFERLQKTTNTKIKAPIQQGSNQNKFSSSSSTSEFDDLQLLSAKYNTKPQVNLEIESDLKCCDKTFEDVKKKLDKQKKIEERENKKKQAEIEKRLKQAVTEANKIIKPTECLKFIQVQIDNDVVNEEYGKDILSSLQAAEVKYRVQSQIVSGIVSWTRTTQSHLLNNEGQLSLSSEDLNTDEILLIMNCKDFVRHVHDSTLAAHIESLVSVLENKRLILAVYGLQKYNKFKKNQKQSEMRAQISDHNSKQSNKAFQDYPLISQRNIEEALTEIQLLSNCAHRLVDSPAEVALFISQLTKSIAEIPYKKQKCEKYERTDCYMAGDNRDCVRVDKDGNGLQRLWKQILTIFPLARLETAEAIMAKYPTISSLIEAYENCGSTQEAEMILQDIQIRRAAGPLSSSRRIGPELSKKVFHFFTSTDGEALYE